MFQEITKVRLDKVPANLRCRWRKKLEFSSAAVLAVLLTGAPAMAQPVLEGIQTTTSIGVNTINLAIPANTVGSDAGDLLVAVIGARINPNVLTPAGWTAITGHAGLNQAICTSDDAGIACQLSAFWKFATAPEASVLITLDTANNNHQSAGAVFRYSSTHTVSPIGPVATQNGSTATPTAPSVMTTENNMRVIQVVVSDTNSGDGFELILENGPPTEVFTLKSASPATFDSIVMGGAEFAEATSGTNTGTASWTGGEQNWRGSTFTIRPEQEIIDADLSITKAGSPAKVNPGDDITYTIVAASSGSSAGDVTGATVNDTFAPSLSCNWTCSASGGASCTAMGSGNISDMVNLPIGSHVTYIAVCTLDLGAADDGNVSNTATIVAPVGTNDTDTTNNSDMETTDINLAPIASCKDVTVDANASCVADASIDDGSNDPDMDDPVTIVEVPAGPYSLGDTPVTLTITDGLGLSDSCMATVTVKDVTPPAISCNNPATIIPPDAPISFTATAEDNCSVDAPAITTFRCFQVKSNGKIIDKGESCIVSIDGDTITIDDSGGVNDQIEWTVTATDGSGNGASTTCLVHVVNPGH